MHMRGMCCGCNVVTRSVSSALRMGKGFHNRAILDVEMPSVFGYTVQNCGAGVEAWTQTPEEPLTKHEARPAFLSIVWC